MLSVLGRPLGEGLMSWVGGLEWVGLIRGSWSYMWLCLGEGSDDQVGVTEQYHLYASCWLNG